MDRIELKCVGIGVGLCLRAHHVLAEVGHGADADDAGDRSHDRAPRSGENGRDSLRDRGCLRGLRLLVRGGVGGDLRERCRLLALQIRELQLQLREQRRRIRRLRGGARNLHDDARLRGSRLRGRNRDLAVERIDLGVDLCERGVVGDDGWILRGGRRASVAGEQEERRERDDGREERGVENSDFHGGPRSEGEIDLARRR